MAERTPNSAATGSGSQRCHRVLCPATRRALALRHRLRATCARDFVLPVVVTLLVLATALAPQSPVRNAATHADVPGVHLAIPTSLAILGPVGALLDMQSLLTVPQHIAVIVTLLVAFVAWRGLAFARGSTWPLWRRECGGLVAVVLLAPVAALLVNVLVPRPMARLVVDDPDVIVVDVHAHTASSHDARPDWTPARVREWHRASGFHVAYITDHKRFGGAIDGLATNPARAGDGVVLLSGLELRSNGQHVNVLSMTSAESTYIVDGDHLHRGLQLEGGRPAVVVQTIPFGFDRFSGPGQDSLPVTRAIEINDGAPRGLTTGLKHHARLLRLADSLDLALVAGSDNHGWGNTASGWTLVTVPGWRDLTPGALAVQLEAALGRGRRATTVVERRTPLLVSPAAVTLTVPVALLTTLRGLTPPERVSWVGWAWAVLLVRVATRAAARRALAQARARRQRRRERMRIVPIGGAVGLPG